jgi:hypothetical protein
MLKAENALTVLILESRPLPGARQLAEASCSARSGAMNEHQRGKIAFCSACRSDLLDAIFRVSEPVKPRSGIKLRLEVFDDGLCRGRRHGLNRIDLKHLQPLQHPPKNPARPLLKRGR